MYLISTWKFCIRYSLLCMGLQSLGGWKWHNGLMESRNTYINKSHYIIQNPKKDTTSSCMMYNLWELVVLSALILYIIQGSRVVSERGIHGQLSSPTNGWKTMNSMYQQFVFSIIPNTVQWTMGHTREMIVPERLIYLTNSLYYCNTAQIGPEYKLWEMFSVGKDVKLYPVTTTLQYVWRLDNTQSYWRIEGWKKISNLCYADDTTL